MGFCGLIVFPASKSSVLNSNGSFVLRPLLETKGASRNNHQSVFRCSYADWNTDVFSWQRKVVVDCSSFTTVSSLLHACIVATENELSLIYRRVCGMMTSP